MFDDEALSVQELEAIFLLAVEDSGERTLADQAALAKLAEVLDHARPRPHGAQTRGELVAETWDARREV